MRTGVISSKISRNFPSGIKNAIPRRLEFPQRLTIIVLILFNFQIMNYIPFRIGPLSTTMMMEFVVFVLVFPWIRIYAHNLDNRDKYILFVCSCMFVLSIVNLSGKMGGTLFRYIFVSMYTYFMIACFFSGRPEYETWLRRLHLIPAFAILSAIISNIFSLNAWMDFEVRIRANHAASYLVMILPICLVQFRRDHGVFRLLNLFIVASTFLILIVTASRTAFICLLIITMLMIIVEKPETKVTIVIASLLIGLTLYISLPAQSEFKSRISTLSTPFSVLSVDRLALWKAAILSIKENPFFGGDFRANVHRLVVEAAPWSNYARHISYNVSGGQFGVHNGYLAVIVYFGIIVAALYFSFFYSLGHAVLNARRKIRDNVNREFLSAGLISLFGYGVINITLHTYMGLEFFIIWAILNSSVKNALLEEELNLLSKK